MEPFQVFARAVSKSLDDMLGGPGSPGCRIVEPPTSVNEEGIVVASIGFGCEHVRGSLTVAATRATAGGFRPTDIDAPNESLDCDVLGEMSNMLLGRVKNQLLDCGVTLMLGMPISVIAHSMHVASGDASAASAWFGLDLPVGTLFVRLEARCEPTLEISAKEPTRTASVGSEGDMLFF